jgi:hypothetical protein
MTWHRLRRALEVGALGVVLSALFWALTVLLFLL